MFNLKDELAHHAGHTSLFKNEKSLSAIRAVNLSLRVRTSCEYNVIISGRPDVDLIRINFG